MYVWSYMILCMGMSCLPNQTVRSWAYGNTLDPSQSFGLLNTPHSFISPWFTKYCLRYWRRARETKMKKKNKNKQQSIFLALLAEWTITVLLVQWGVSRHARGEILINQAYFRWEFGGNVIPRMFHGITKSSQTNDCYEMEPQKVTQAPREKPVWTLEVQPLSQISTVYTHASSKVYFEPQRWNTTSAHVLQTKGVVSLLSEILS